MSRPPSPQCTRSPMTADARHPNREAILQAQAGWRRQMASQSAGLNVARHHDGHATFLHGFADCLHQRCGDFHVCKRGGAQPSEMFVCIGKTMLVAKRWVVVWHTSGKNAPKRRAPLGRKHRGEGMSPCGVRGRTCIKNKSHVAGCICRRKERHASVRRDLGGSTHRPESR